MNTIDYPLHSAKDLYPEPSPHAPNQLAANVLRVPEIENQEFLKAVVSRYKRQLLRYPIQALFYTLTHRQLETISDRDFSQWLSDGAPSKFLNPQFDPVDRENFVPFLTEQSPSTVLYKVDTACVQDLTAFPGIYVEPTVTLLQKHADGQFEALAIQINGLCLTPQDVNAWSLAKHFVVQGVCIGITLCEHPRLHFPMDAINAISKTTLPQNHLLFKLLEPHLYLSLPLDNRVLQHPRSVYINNQKEIHTPFSSPLESQLQPFIAGYSGIPNNSSYPAYSYPMSVPKIHSDYGIFLSAYYSTIYSFVRKIIAKIPPQDGSIRQWADQISQWVPGFPNGDAIFQEDNLIAAVTFFIWDVTVGHATDHWEVGHYEPHQYSYRLRVAPPTSKTISPINRSKLLKLEDIFRHKMAQHMFFRPNNVTLLHDTRYDFDDPELIQANHDFLEALKQTDTNLPVKRYIPLSEISRSIQY
jgi:hypothetical protein